jgi:hypothetical protein
MADILMRKLNGIREKIWPGSGLGMHVTFAFR